jgi:Tol biopolymer transport system component
VHHLLRHPTAALVGAALLAACGDGPTPPPPPPALVIEVEGRRERGAELVLAATVSGVAVPAAQVTWSFTPAAAVDVLEPGRVRLLAAGALEIRGRRGENDGMLAVTVELPPTVVFDMLVNGNRDLYRIALDGGGLQRLTTEPADDSAPTVAGGNVVFVSYRDGNAELYSMPLAGGTATRLTTTQQAETSPALSRDGQRLAFTFEPSGVGKIFTATSTNQNRAQAAPGFGFAGSPETAPTWAPAGDRLAFVGTANGTADIFEVIPGGVPTLVVGGPHAYVNPAWSPDGSRIAFASNRDGDAAVYVVTRPGGVVTRLSDRPGTEAEPAWTADGRLVYVEFLTGSADGRTSRLVWIDPASPSVVHPIEVAGSPRNPATPR